MAEIQFKPTPPQLQNPGAAPLPSPAPKQGFSNFNQLLNRLEGSLKPRFLVPVPRDSDSVGLGWGFKLCYEADVAS